KVWVIVIDGVNIGFLCCTVHNCKVPLKNNWHHFCPEDLPPNHICVIVECDSPTIPNSHACSDLEHQ
ncbi:hypothetical protein L208DRAFT_1038242, partial [Tricholoma matsutake]